MIELKALQKQVALLEADLKPTGLASDRLKVEWRAAKSADPPRPSKQGRSHPQTPPPRTAKLSPQVRSQAKLGTEGRRAGAMRRA